MEQMECSLNSNRLQMLCSRCSCAKFLITIWSPSILIVNLSSTGHISSSYMAFSLAMSSQRAFVFGMNCLYGYTIYSTKKEGVNPPSSAIVVWVMTPSIVVVDVVQPSIRVRELVSSLSPDIYRDTSTIHRVVICIVVSISTPPIVNRTRVT